MRYGNGLTPELISYFPKPKSGSGWMLDLGCGRRNYASLCQEVTGLNYVGIDYDGSEPDLLVDVHSLPFADDSFDLIISMAVLEHLSHPDIAMSEAFRTLKPGAVFVGTVAFLETFHMDSHFHMTHLGTNRILRQAGFELLALAPNRAWTGLRAQAEMALFPGLPHKIQRALVSPSELISKLLWALKRKAKGVPDLDRLVQTTGGFRFVARKPVEAAVN
jgi:SAM-dependent methyltransferase